MLPYHIIETLRNKKMRIFNVMGQREKCYADPHPWPEDNLEEYVNMLSISEGLIKGRDCWVHHLEFIEIKRQTT